MRDWPGSSEGREHRSSSWIGWKVLSTFGIIISWLLIYYLESPLRLLFPFAPSCQIQEERFFFFLTTVHLGAAKAANYCHHCPWKCITPHLRAHSIKETEGVINRRPLTFIQRKNRQNKSLDETSLPVSCPGLNHWRPSSGSVMLFRELKRDFSLFLTENRAAFHFCDSNKADN